MELALLFNLVKDLKGFDFLYFQSPILVKSSPHHHARSIWGVTVNKDGKVYLLTDTYKMDGEWIELEQTDFNFQVVASSVYQRLLFIKNEKKQTA
jgi:hypothetical protein